MASRPLLSRAFARLLVVVLLGLVAAILPATPAAAAAASAVGGATVTGKVLAPDGSAAPNIPVEAVGYDDTGDSDPAPAGSTTTGADGTFALTLGAGSYYVDITPDAATHWLPASRYVTVPGSLEPQAIAPITLLLANVRGVVTDSAGQPVADAFVYLENADTEDGHYGYSGEDGSYMLHSEPGAFTVTAEPSWAANPLLDVASAARPGTVATAGDQATGHDLQLQASNVRGTIVAPDGTTAYGDVSLSVMGLGDSGSDGMSVGQAEDGRWSLRATPGTYRVTATPYYYNNPSGLQGGSIDVTVTAAHTPAAPLAGQTITLTEPNVRGVVRNPDGTPAPYAYVRAPGGPEPVMEPFGASARLEPGSHEDIAASTNERGEFGLQLAAGQWTLTADPNTYETAAITVIAGQATIDVVAGTPRHDVVVTLTKPNVAGQVVDPAGQPVIGSSVVISPVTGDGSETYLYTNGAGAFAARLAAGEYRVVGRPGYDNEDRLRFGRAEFTIADVDALLAGTNVALRAPLPPAYQVHRVGRPDLGEGYVPYYFGPMDSSADGRRVVWEVGGDVPDDYNQPNRYQIFAADTAGNTFDLVTATPAGDQTTGYQNHAPAISGDGRYVTWFSNSQDLVDGDDNWYMDVYVRDLVDGVTTRVSDDNTLPSYESSTPPAISDDGRYVAYAADGPGGEYSRILVWDRLSGQPPFEVDGDDSGTVQFNRISLSGDGATAAYYVRKPHTPADPSDMQENDWALRVWNRTTGKAPDQPVNTIYDSASTELSDISITTDGSKIAYTTMELRGENAQPRVIPQILDRVAGGPPTTPDFAAHGWDFDESGGISPNSPPEMELSADGSALAFKARVREIGDDQYRNDSIYTWDLAAERLDEVPVGPSGVPARSVERFAMSADGGTVTFGSYDDTIVPGGTEDSRLTLFTALRSEEEPPAWAAGSQLSVSNVGSTLAKLTWPAATDNVAVAGYRVFVNGLKSGDDLPNTARSKQLTGLVPGTAHTFAVKAFDAAGNETPTGLTALATTKAAGGVANPQLLADPGTGGKVDLHWDEYSGAGDLATYRVKRSVSGVVVETVDVATSQTGHSFTGLASATTFGFQLFGFDQAGVESALSTVTEATTPALTIMSTIGQAPTVRTGVARMGEKLAVTVRGEAGRTGTAIVTTDNWFEDGTLLEAPKSKARLVNLTEDPVAPGVYKGDIVLTEGTARVTRVQGAIGDGHTQVTRDWPTTNGLGVSGALTVEVHAGEQSLNEGTRLVVSSGSTGFSGSQAISGGGVSTFSAVLPAGDYTIAVLDVNGRVAAHLGGVAVRSGLTATAEVTPVLPAALTVTMRDRAGAPVAGMRFAIDTDLGVFAGSGTTDRDGAATYEGLASGQTVTVRAVPGWDSDATADTATVALVAGANQAALTVDRPTPATVRGIVRRSDGSPARDAMVTFQQDVTDERTRTFTDLTDERGAYEIVGYAGAGRLSVGERRETAGPTEVTLVAGDPLTRDWTLTLPVPREVLVHLNTRQAAGEPYTTAPLDWRTAVHFGMSGAVEGRGFSMYQFIEPPEGEQGGIVEVEGNDGQTITICARGAEAGLLDGCGSATFAAGQRRVTVEVFLDPAPSVTGTITADGQPYEGSWQAQASQLQPDGSYQDSRAFYGSGPELELPLVGPGTWRVSVIQPSWAGAGNRQASVNLQAGAGERVDIGALNMAPSTVFRSLFNEVTATRNDALAGTAVELRAAFRNDSEVAQNGITARIHMPAGTTLQPGSVSLNGTPVTPVDGNQSADVAVGTLAPEASGVLRYRLQVPAGFGRSQLTAAVDMVRQSGDAEALRPAIVAVSSVTLDAPKETGSRSISVSGRAPAGTTVAVREEGTTLATATTGPGGYWRADVTLADRGSSATYTLRASAAVDGATLESSPATITLDGTRPQLTKVSLRQVDPHRPDGRRYSFDPRQGVARFPFVFVPGQDTVVEMEFDKPERVTSTLAHIGQDSAPGVKDEAGVFVATMPNASGRGDIYVEFESIPVAPVVPSQPDLSGLRSALPSGMAGFTYEAGGEAGSNAATIDIETPGAPNATPVGGAITMVQEERVLTAADVAFEAQSGVPVYGFTVDLESTPGVARMEALVPLDRLPGAAPAPSPASAKRAGKVGLAGAEGAAVSVARVGFEKAFNLATNGDAGLSAATGGGKYDDIGNLYDKLGDCPPAVMDAHNKALQGIANRAAFLDVANAAIAVASVVVAPATFGLGTVALWGAGWLIGKASDAYIGDQIQQAEARIDSSQSCQPDPNKPKDPGGTKAGSPVWIYDPSGYVYEGVESNRLEGVTATLLHAPSLDGPWTPEDMAPYGQVNPLITDDIGKYGWDVPEGYWKVQWTKDGYETGFSAALTVLPVHLDVNHGMVKLAAPGVVSAAYAAGGSVLVTFDKYMRAASVADAITVATTGASPAAIPGTVTAVGSANDPAGVPVAKVFRFQPDDGFVGDTTVAVTATVAATDHSGRTLAAASTKQVAIPSIPGPPSLALVQGLRSPSSSRAPRWTVTAPAGATSVTCEVLDSADPPVVVAAIEPCGAEVTGDLTGKADGVYTLRAVGSNLAGRGPAGTSAYRLDTVAPVAPSVGVLASPGKNPVPSITIGAVEEGAAAVCRVLTAAPVGGTSTGVGAAPAVAAKPVEVVEAGPCGAAYAPDLSAQSDGSYVLVVEVFDEAGNASGAVNRPYVLDQAAPAAAGITLTPAGPAGNANPALGVSAEAGASVTCTIIGPAPFAAVGPVACGTLPASLALGGDGTYTVSVGIVDAAGNAGPGSSATYALDRAAPAAPGLTGPAAGRFRDVTVDVTSGESGAGVVVACRAIGADGVPLAGAGAPFVPCGPTFALAIPANGPEGTYRVEGTVTDAAGNTSAEGRFSYLLDLTAPAAPVLNGPARGGDTPSFTVTAEVGARVGCEVRQGSVAGPVVRSMPAPGCGTSYRPDLSGLAEGVYVVLAAAQDTAGNIGPAGSFPYTLMRPVVNPGSVAGYRLVDRSGAVYSFGNAVYAGGLAGTPLAAPLIGSASTPDGKGYWLVGADGGVYAFGSARFHGSTGAMKLNKPIVGMAAAPDGQGYWLVASDGGIFSFGSARFAGSTGGMALNRPIVGMAAVPDGGGYWLVASDGGIFSFGSARFAGSTGGMALNRPIVGMAAVPGGGGYWLVASDGGIFAFGTATFHGSTGGLPLVSEVIGMVPAGPGRGYWLVGRDGGVFAFNAPFHGSLGGGRTNLATLLSS